MKAAEAASPTTIISGYGLTSSCSATTMTTGARITTVGAPSSPWLRRLASSARAARKA